MAFVLLNLLKACLACVGIDAFACILWIGAVAAGPLVVINRRVVAVDYLAEVC